jgi:ABC-type multidrug transport system fused ATPase/permease subunit
MTTRSDSSPDSTGGAWPSIRAAVGLLLRRERVETATLGLSIAAVEIFQIASVALVLPAVSVIVDPTLLDSDDRLGAIHGLLGAPPVSAFVLALTGAAVAGLVVGHLGAFGTKVWNERLAARLAVRIARRVMADFMRAPYSWFLDRNATALTRVVNEEASAWARDLIGAGLRMVSSLLAALLAAALVVAVAPLGGLTMILLFVLLAALAARAIGGPVMRWSLAGRKASRDAYVVAHQMLAGIKDVQAGQGQEHFLDIFDEAAGRRARARATAAIYSHLPPEVISLFVQAGLLVVMIALWVTGARGGEIAAQMAVVVLAAVRITPAMIRFQKEGARALQILPLVTGMIEVARSARSARQAAAADRQAADAPGDWREIAFQRVSYTYPGGRAPALREARFSIPRGSVTGLVGPSGAGKSTCIDVLTGLLQPTEGAVALDRTSLADIDQDAWRERIGYVPQDPYLTEDTIAANVAFGLDIDSTRVAEAIAGACLTAFVADLPRGIETPLGDRGRQVSGGQRQRIAIARALYRKPQLLILDEATSALDARTERAVIETIERLKGSVTVLVVSHRRSTLAACDRIVELDAGCVVADRPVTPAAGSAEHA